MDPIADYLAAAYPEPVTLLGQRLQPFSLGHMELLARFRNGYVTSGNSPTLDDLAFGVFVCCQSWREAQTALLDVTLHKKLKAWGNRLPQFSFEEKSEAFVRYLVAGSTQPHTLATEPGGEDTGVSLLQAVRLVLMGELGCSREEAMDYPWGLARWDYYAWHAQQGHLRLVGRELAEHLAWAEDFNRRNAVLATN